MKRPGPRIAPSQWQAGRCEALWSPLGAEKVEYFEILNKLRGILKLPRRLQISDSMDRITKTNKSAQTSSLGSTRQAPSPAIALAHQPSGVGTMPCTKAGFGPGRDRGAGHPSATTSPTGLRFLTEVGFFSESSDFSGRGPRRGEFLQNRAALRGFGAF